MRTIEFDKDTGGLPMEIVREIINLEELRELLMTKGLSRVELRAVLHGLTSWIEMLGTQAIMKSIALEHKRAKESALENTTEEEDNHEDD